jgi:hypothetical protein
MFLEELCPILIHWAEDMNRLAGRYLIMPYGILPRGDHSLPCPADSTLREKGVNRTLCMRKANEWRMVR